MRETKVKIAEDGVNRSFCFFYATLRVKATVLGGALSIAIAAVANPFATSSEDCMTVFTCVAASTDGPTC